jgi:hypothetical protein
LYYIILVDSILNDDIALLPFALFVLLLPNDDRRRVVYDENKRDRAASVQENRC